MSAITKPSIESPRNSIDSLSNTPPLASSWTRERWVSACSSRPRSRKRYPMRALERLELGAERDDRAPVRRSSRWLSIRRRALLGTPPARPETRSSCSAIGNGVRGMSEVTSAAMPCASSRPRTTSASIGDWVRKTVTRSGIGIRGQGAQAAGPRSRALTRQSGPPPAPPPSSGSWSCRRADRRVPTNDSISRRMRSRSSPDSRWPCSSTMRLSRASPNRSASQVHRLADAVGVEDDDVAVVEVDASLLRAAR